MWEVFLLQFLFVSDEMKAKTEWEDFLKESRELVANLKKKHSHLPQPQSKEWLIGLAALERRLEEPSRPSAPHS